jgi:hypothetical protein
MGGVTHSAMSSGKASFQNRDMSLKMLKTLFPNNF